VPSGKGQNWGEVEASSASDTGVRPTPTELAVPPSAETRGWPIAVLILGGTSALYAVIGFALYEFFAFIL
jgi:hypothetical protein